MSEQREKLDEIIKDFDTAMLVTTCEDGLIRARPMRIVDHGDDAELWFVSARDTSKVEEIEEDLTSAVVLQKPGRYARLSGMATIIDDAEIISTLWSPIMRPWFPEGTDSDRIVAIRFVPMEGEYWDSTGLDGIKYVFETVKAALRRKTPEVPEPDLHAIVSM